MNGYRTGLRHKMIHRLIALLSLLGLCTFSVPALSPGLSSVQTELFAAGTRRRTRSSLSVLCRAIARMHRAGPSPRFRPAVLLLVDRLCQARLAKHLRIHASVAATRSARLLRPLLPRAGSDLAVSY